MAVVQVSSYSLDSTPSLGTSICHKCGPKKTKEKKKKKKNVSEGTNDLNLMDAHSHLKSA